jgi:hypothetical protein
MYLERPCGGREQKKKEYRRKKKEEIRGKNGRTKWDRDDG